MTAVLTPRLKRLPDGPWYSITGRLATIGSRPGCQVHMSDPGVGPIAAHLIFVNGRYHAQKIEPDAAVTLNNRPVDRQMPLSTGDRLRIGPVEFEFMEEATPLAAGPDGSVDTGSGIGDMVSVIVSLLKNRDRNIYTDLVASVSRLLACDAARLVGEENGVRTTLACYPSSSGQERFSTRAIDWARDSLHTVLAQDADWRDAGDSKTSLEKNQVGSVLCAPLNEGDALLGYLYLDRLRKEHPFSESDRAFCDTLLPLFSEILSNDRERRRQRDTIARLQSAGSGSSGGMIYESETMQAMVTLAARLAQTDSPVMVLGETGTGKELMARFLHDRSRREGKPYRPINCGAIPATLIESELFGHEKGAFTGASQKKAGLFEAADGGTVFLDEIGELPQLLQVKLLRVLQESEIIRVGGTETIKVDVRIVAATNRNLELEVREGRFRQDLYFRLNVLTLVLPPLRDRGDDVLLLAEFFLKKYCTQFGIAEKVFGAAARNTLKAHHWPGNIRELENVVQKAVLLSPQTRINREDLSIGSATSPGDNPDSLVLTLKEARNRAEKSIIVQTLVRTRGNVSTAAKQLDIDRKWLMKMMDELGISADEYRGK